MATRCAPRHRWPSCKARWMHLRCMTIMTFATAVRKRLPAVGFFLLLLLAAPLVWLSDHSTGYGGGKPSGELTLVQFGDGVSRTASSTDSRADGVDGDGDDGHSGGGGVSVAEQASPPALSSAESHHLNRLEREAVQRHEATRAQARRREAAIGSADACKASGGDAGSFNTCGGTTYCCGVCTGRKSCQSRQGWLLEGCACNTDQYVALSSSPFV